MTYQETCPDCGVGIGSRTTTIVMSSDARSAEASGSRVTVLATIR